MHAVGGLVLYIAYCWCFCDLCMLPVQIRTSVMRLSIYSCNMQPETFARIAFTTMSRSLPLAHCVYAMCARIGAEAA